MRDKIMIFLFIFSFLLGLFLSFTLISIHETSPKNKSSISIAQTEEQIAGTWELVSYGTSTDRDAVIPPETILRFEVGGIYAESSIFGDDSNESYYSEGEWKITEDKDGTYVTVRFNDEIITNFYKVSFIDDDIMFLHYVSMTPKHKIDSYFEFKRMEN